MEYTVGICWWLCARSSLQWRHTGCDSVSNHQPYDCLLNRLFRHRSRKTSKLCVTGLCAWNSPVTGEFPVQKASNAENVSIWWHHHVRTILLTHLSYHSLTSNHRYIKHVIISGDHLFACDVISMWQRLHPCGIPLYIIYTAITINSRPADAPATDVKGSHTKDNTRLWPFMFNFVHI